MYHSLEVRERTKLYNIRRGLSWMSTVFTKNIPTEHNYLWHSLWNFSSCEKTVSTKATPNPRKYDRDGVNSFVLHSKALCHCVQAGGLATQKKELVCLLDWGLICNYSFVFFLTIKKRNDSRPAARLANWNDGVRTSTTIAGCCLFIIKQGMCVRNARAA